MLNLSCEKNKNKQKEAGFGTFLENNFIRDRKEKLTVKYQMPGETKIALFRLLEAVH